MAVFEEQLIYEQSRAGSLKEKLEKESERRETVQGELDTTKQVRADLECVWGGYPRYPSEERHNKKHMAIYFAK